MLVAVDTETTGLVPWGNPKKLGYFPPRPYAVTWCGEDEQTHFERFPINPKTREVLYHLNHKGCVRVQKLVGNPHNHLVMHNAPFDLRHLAAAGFVVNAEYSDTRVMMKVATGGLEPSYKLKALGVKYFGVPKDDEEALHKSTVAARRRGKSRGWIVATKELGFGQKPVPADYWMADPDLLEYYARMDSHRTILLYLLAQQLLEEGHGLVAIHDRERALHPVFQTAEKTGVRVILSNCVALEKYYKGALDKYNGIKTALGHDDLNIRSPKQLRDIFIEQKGYDVVGYTDAGYASMNNDALQYYAASHKDPLASAIIEWKIADKGLNGFVLPYQRFATPSEGVHLLHPDYDAMGAVTGRISCRDPNLMQVADAKKNKNTEVKNRARECLGPRKGHLWYLPDYSQIEVWLFAFLSQDPIMMKALLDGHNFHRFNAQTIWGKRQDYAAAADGYYKRGKIVMFTKLYGGGVAKVAEQMGCSMAEAKRFIDDFDSRLPNVSKFIERMYNMAQRQGWITNPFGRIYYFHQGQEYKAVNYLIQGTAADIMKGAMVAVYWMLEDKYPEVKLLLTIHDELVIEVPDHLHSLKLMRDIVFEMQREHSICSIPVRFPVDMEISRTTWNEKRKVRLAA